MKTRAYNFGAGPATLPESILLEAQAELMNWQGLGMSILEIGHRTEPFQALLIEAEALLRELLTIPAHYRILFLGGAARSQFALVPMNCLLPEQQAGYLISGIWSSLAFDEACKLIQGAYCLASSAGNAFKSIPSKSEWKLRQNTGYIYYTPNETINGVRIAEPPQIDNIPVIADMTSCLLSEPINVSDYALIFAGAQKNISIAGLTIVIIREDLLAKSTKASLPTMMDYNTHANHHSLYATPPVFNCYLALKMFQWVKAQGGVNALYQLNCQKAALLYQYIDASAFYSCDVEKNARSLMNICFSLVNKNLEEHFITGANQHGLLALRGHRSVGGLRASLYNAMPKQGVDALLNYMQEFANEHAQ